MSSEPISTSGPHRSGYYEVRIIAWLLGFGCGLHLSGIAALYQAMLDPLPQTAMLVVCVALLSAAIGPWLPQGVLTRWFRILDAPETEPLGGAAGGWMPRSVAPALRGVLWVVLALSCLLAGTTALLLLWATGPLDHLLHWASGRFFLSRFELLAVDTVTVAAGVAVPWAVVGMSIACLYALQARRQPLHRLGTGVLGSLLMAAGVGMALSRLGMLAASPPRTALIGALPFILAAVVAVARAGQRRDLESDDDDTLHLPERAPEAGYALLGCLGICGAMTGGAMVAWPRSVALDMPLTRELPLVTSAWVLGWVGVGVLLGGVVSSRRSSPISECGPVLVIAGAAGGFAIAVNALVGMVVNPESSASSAPWLSLILAALALQGAALGWATAYFKRSVLIQSGSPAVGSAQALSTLLVGGALGSAAAALWLIPAAGTLVALATGSLAALATGGLLVIFDVGGPSRSRTRRLAGVFGVLVVFMIVLPSISGRWLTRPERRAMPREGAWFTAMTVQGNAIPHVELRRATRRASTPSDCVAMSRALAAVLRLRDRFNAALVLSAGDVVPGRNERARCRRWTLGAYDPVAAVAFRGFINPTYRGVEQENPPRSGLRTLRVELDTYDLIVISPIPGGHCLNEAVWSVEVLRRLSDSLAVRGILAGLVRPGDYSRSDLAALVATFVAATADRTYGGLVGTGDEQVLVLLSTSDAEPRWQWTAAAAEGLRRIGPLQAYLQLAHGVRPNSLRSPSLSDLGRRTEGGVELTRFVSTSPSWREVAPSKRPITILPPNLAPGGE